MNIKAQTGVTIDGKYRLLTPIGAGAMGAVWLAEQLSVDRKVAVKLLHPSENQSNGLDARFAVEAKAIARLNHPNCITLYDFGYSEELEAFYTVIEYVKGVVLGKKMGAPIGFNDAIAIIRQAALGLDHAHFHNILHRDLKPDNLMLAEQSDGSELLKILDFGIAKIVHGEFGEISGDDDIRLTKAGEVFGTPAYMSPEQARSARELTPAADFYALGVILYEMIEGHLPFSASTSFDVLMMHVSEEVPRLQRTDVPEEIVDVIYKLLEKHPDDRFQSGKEIIAALGSRSFKTAPLKIPGNSVRPSQPTALGPMSASQPMDSTFPPQSALITQSPTKAKKRYWIVVILLGLVSVGLIAWLAVPKEPSGPGSESFERSKKMTKSDEGSSNLEAQPSATQVENELVFEKESKQETAEEVKKATTGTAPKDVPKAKKRIGKKKKKKIEKTQPKEKVEHRKLKLVEEGKDTVIKLGLD